MPQNHTKAFIQALQSAEASKDVGPLVRLFDDRAELENPARGASRRGTDGATAFWSDYLSAFESIHSEFTHVLEADGSATLEWVSEGRLAKSGEPISYRGTSILEFTAGGRVSRFATYYDSAAFVPGGSRHTARTTDDAAAGGGGHPAGGVPS